MYLSFYGLQQKPFPVSTNPSFVWLGKMHKKVLAILQYGILQDQGFLVLTGDVGTGKTTLVNALINTLGDDVAVAKVPDPGLELIDFLNYISHAFGMDKRFACKEDFLIHFDRFLQGSAAAGKKVLLIIDEAQRLNSALLEEIRQLSNIEEHQTKVLNILFAGQNLFNDFLQESGNRALSQRIAINAAIGPLSIDDTADYIRQSLKIAGAEKDIFSTDALRNVHEFSGGFLRRINIICDHAMFLGYLQGRKTVTVDMVRECAEDLCLPDVEHLQDIPQESVEVIAPIQAWKIMGTVILIIIGVFFATYYNYPQEYRTFFSWIQKTARRDEVDAAGEAKVSGAAAMKMVTAQGRVVEKMAPAEIVVEEQSADDQLLEPPAVIDTIDTVNLDAIQPIEESNIDEVHTPSVQINELSFSEQQRSKEQGGSESIPALTDDMPMPYTKTEAGDEGSDVSDVSEAAETREAPAPEEIPAPTVDSFVAEAEEIEESEEAVEETPAGVDPGAVIDWVIKKRSE
jgi:type II secretory pathway predicted ATPase ExeA